MKILTVIGMCGLLGAAIFACSGGDRPPGVGLPATGDSSSSGAASMGAGGTPAGSHHMFAFYKSGATDAPWAIARTVA